jgi:hypothetical protein
VLTNRRGVVFKIRTDYLFAGIFKGTQQLIYAESTPVDEINFKIISPTGEQIHSYTHSARIEQINQNSANASSFAVPYLGEGKVIVYDFENDVEIASFPAVNRLGQSADDPSSRYNVGQLATGSNRILIKQTCIQSCAGETTFLRICG